MPFRRPFALVSLLVIALMNALTAGGVAGQESDMSVTVELQEFDDSGISGTAVLTETSTGGTHVSMVLVGAELDGNHPTHIHTGTCENFDPNPLYPLETVNLSPVDEEGMSETTLEDVDLTELYEGEYVILVHQSPEELTNYLVCGEIGSGTVGTEAPESTGSTPPVDHMPASGVGSTVANGLSGSGFAILFAALALLSAFAGGLIRRSAK